jgi:hypothetical protein
MAQQIHRRMRHGDRARVFSSRVYNASQMTMLLRALDLLVTSRYHAAVLSLAAAVPQVAVGHDLRLATLYQELGLEGECFLRPGAGMFAALGERVEALLADPDRARAILCRGHEEHLCAARRNRELLRAFVRAHGWEVRA